MHNCNTMGLIGYLIETVWWSILSVAGYRAVCFKILNGQTFDQSRLVLWSLLVISIVIGFWATYRKRRNNLSIVVTIAIPLGIYSSLSCWEMLKPFIIATLLITALVILAYFGLVFDFKRISDKFWEHLAWFAAGARTIGGIGLSVLVAFLYLSGLFGQGLLKPSVDADYRTPDGTPVTVIDHIDKLSALVDGRWKSLDIKEKTDILQIVANLESDSLGLGHELNVGIDILEGDAVGYYRDRSHQIMVDFYHLDEEPLEVVNTVCHEAYHAYEHRLAQLYIATPKELRGLQAIAHSAQYAEEFADYKNTKNGSYHDYYYQSVEEDARIHAGYAAEEYLKEVSWHTPAAVAPAGN